MARRLYTEEDHRKAYIVWLKEGTFGGVSNHAGMPTPPTIKSWSKDDYRCPFGCKWHGYERLREEGETGEEGITVIPPKMNDGRPSRSEILDRRKEQFTLRTLGATPAAIHAALAPKYNVSVATLDDDWKHRADWMLEAATLTELREVVSSRMYRYTIDTSYRYNIVNMLREMLTNWRRQKNEELQEEGRNIGPEDLKEISGLIYYIRGLLNDVDAATDREIKAVVSVGAMINFEVGRQDEEEEREARRSETRSLMDAIMEGMPESAQGHFMLALERAVEGSEEGAKEGREGEK